MLSPSDPQSGGVESDAVQLVRSAFLEMPGLQLTKAQTARLCALDATTCEAVLQQLVASGFLVQTSQATFARAAALASGA